MLNRQNKRKIKTTFSFVAGTIVVVLLVVLLASGYKLIAPLTKMGIISSNNKMIKPVGTSTTVTGLTKQLAEKNIILSSIASSSMSGVIIGKVKEGPTVYFSEIEEAAWQVEALFLIMSRTTVDNKKPTLIDLRTGRPIVKF